MARLLIVDDNDTIRFLMRSYLEVGGHVVCGEAKNGIDGVVLAKETLPDVVLLDLTMPELSGIETAAMLKRALPETPIILFTLHEDGINQELAATMGVDMVVNKVDGVPKLAESVRALLQRTVPTEMGIRGKNQKEDRSAASERAPAGKLSDIH